MAGSDGALTRTPESTTLVPGTLLRLNCSTDRSIPVIWSLTTEDSTPVDIASGSNVVIDFIPYFYVDSSSQYDLVAKTWDANESYCGEYTCTEHDFGGDSSSATVASKCTQLHTYTLDTYTHVYQ